MSKRFIIGVSIMSILVLGLTSIVFAQDPEPPSDGICPYGGSCDGYGMGGYGMSGYGYHGAMPDLLAEALGMTVEELDLALSEGQTVAEIAAAQGVELADLVAALIAPRLENLQQAVDAGYLTQEQADWMIEEMTEHMVWRLENYGLDYGGYGGGGCGMMGGGYGHRGGMMGGGYGHQGGMWDGNYSGRSGGMRGGRWGGNSSAPSFSPRAASSTDL